MKVKDFAEQFKSQLFIQGLVQGNMTEDQALDVDSMMRNKLSFCPLSQDCVTDIYCAELSTGVTVVSCDSLAGAGDSNRLVTNYYQLEPESIRASRAGVSTLRTQEQLGYAVIMTLTNCLSP